MILEAKQAADSDRKMREITELRNRVQGHGAYVARSYSEFGWLLDNEEQERIRALIQKSKDLPSDEEDFGVLQDLMGELEESAAKLTAAMFSLPEDSPARAAMKDGEDSEASMQRILKSALKETQKKE
jgi:hypothetical protein